MQGTAILRERRTRDYFNQQLADLIEAITLPVEREYFPIDRVEELRGAVEYASFMGDIEQPYKRRLTDNLNELYQEAMDQHNAAGQEEDNGNI